MATVSQRRAANIRERRRMFNLNEAFDKLRRKVNVPLLLHLLLLLVLLSGLRISEKKKDSSLF